MSLRTVFAVDGRRLIFESPLDVVAPTAARDVSAAFERVEAALRDGYSVAGYLSYELGAAFLGHDVRRLEGVPLFAVGIYAAARDAEPAPYDAVPTYAMPVALVSRREYDRALAEIARRLIAGDVYQVNLTVPFASIYCGDPFALFEHLLSRAGVAHAAFVEHGERRYLSLSPEMFLRFAGDEVLTKPMKGTSQPDAAAGLDGAKDRAEHLMIVDLLRNDLGRVCDAVRVERLFETERYPTFATMTSTIRGRLRQRVRLYEIFEAMFPCGSITGAPKRAAMATIAELETEPRGIAMGSIGYLLPNRTGVWNVAIRTLATDARDGRIDVRIGGGIVADSNAGAEWAEILIKRRLFAGHADGVALFETLRTGASAADCAAHAERFCDSAARLGIPFLASTIERTIADAAKAMPGDPPQLVRIELTAEGELSQTRRPLDAVEQPVRVCVAPVRLDSTDPFLRHKTTRRAPYDEASAFARTRGCFEALLRNERGDLADGSRTTLFVRETDGTFATPSLYDGALAGTLRARLIASGEAHERTVSIGELARNDVMVGNAARGLLAATLVS